MCLAKLGMWKGSKAASFIAAWTIASQAMGRPITIAEYSEWWKEPLSTAYRHRALFREVFPDLQTPQPIADAAIVRADEWMSRGIAGFSQLPVEGLIA